jgi:RimJ/RimL family protein N-acetyltransferase
MWAPADDAQRLFLGNWAAMRLGVPGISRAEDFGPFEAIAVLVDGALAAVVVYHGYQPERQSIEMSVAADTPAWLTRKVILEVLRYPFEQLSINRAGAGVPHRNRKALRLDKGVGFREEGVLRDAFGPGNHCVVLRMLRSDYLAAVKRFTCGGKKVDPEAARSGEGRQG